MRRCLLVSLFAALFLLCAACTPVGEPAFPYQEQRGGAGEPHGARIYTLGYHYTPDTPSIIVGGTLCMTPADQWSLQSYCDGRWIEEAALSAGAFQLTSNPETAWKYEYNLSLEGLRLPSAQYRLYHAASGDRSNTFCIGDLAAFSAGRLEPSPYGECPEREDVTLELRGAWDGVVRYAMVHHNDQALESGCGAWIEVQRGKTWYRLPSHFGFELVSLEMDAPMEVEELLSLDHYDLPFCPGRYRLVKCCSVQEEDFCISVAFPLTGEQLCTALPLREGVLEPAYNGAARVKTVKLSNCTAETIRVLRDSIAFSPADEPVCAPALASAHLHLDGRAAIEPGAAKAFRLTEEQFANPGRYRFYLLCEAGELYWATGEFEVPEP